MVRCKTRTAKKDDNVYTLEQLPDEKKKRYHSMLEDFDKQVESHIEEARSNMEDIMKQIRNSYKVEIFKLLKGQKDLNQEELVLKNIEEKKKKHENVRESSIFQSNLEKVSENVGNLVINQIAKVEKSAKKRARGGASTIKKVKKKQSFNEPPPPSTGLRRSTRKRIPSERSFLNMETPYGGIGLAKGPLTSTAYSNRTRGMGRNLTVMQTPCGPNYTAAFADVSNVLPTITPKFDMATPFNRQLTVMRTAKQNETIISLGGSPIYVGQTSRKNRRGKANPPSSPADLVAIGIGDGKKLMIPTNNGIDSDEKAQPLDLDEEALKRLKMLRDNLENMIKNY